MSRRQKTEEEQIDDAVVHALLSGMTPKHRSAVLGELSENGRRKALESEYDGRVAHWNRTHDTKWGEG
ncbi:hypothetical protein [Amycolatopsis keratiniphila]|uniref:Uncharacterized protein n=1 Tax=Amycolatopsis keratiniphila TaxID=129921 RepID=R4TD13_9PSEU|nr:hypothetical protein [Amycolatopsis keratiniphila]AGM10131.1 hypothetical protein AORI_7549 [Amycolatopsis keratiniphila]